MKRIGFSGSLDPITNGHMWVIGEARQLADEVIVFISENPFKHCHFTAAQREKIVIASCHERAWYNVKVVVVKGDYTARAAKHHGVDYLIRGIRNNADFDYENLLQQANVEVIDGAKTLFVMPPRDLGSVSSTFVRGLQGPVGWHWHMKKFVPRPAYQAWIEDWLHREWAHLWPDSPERATDRAANDERASQSPRHMFLQKILSAYSGPRRYYHDLEHLVHGLSELKVYAANHSIAAHDLRVLQLAFWFHDFIYRGEQNESDEEASAQAWLAAQLDPTCAEEVAQLIRATEHSKQVREQSPLAKVLIGADLAILGQSHEIYTNYAQAVRREYQYVNDDLFWIGRQRVLCAMLQKAETGILFEDAYFADLYQAQSCDNLRWEIEECQAKMAMQTTV
ncbi:pantetheine-phosphate adenylyltransferase [Undibacterium cyanobacteriorum]|uniref:Phosphopantetheine adenylyltransferase n=1 Tax=Undibacterium cyanobacteriorum TaxID=3073561 RepID=A0ABY9RNV7_9BURK|nr:pantetheine-phosphate adenylyltransferase [Undibacterium sp. 20NA77.5]WMW82122.1 pantetheine-phosphate adenylyltransferase [Undibacterium sp. 20NA77.5]